jgi:non-heme chloroperoxidase
MNSNTITTKDGTQIYYKDWGKGPVVTFSHGWPLNSDAWDRQMFFLAQNGFRVVAHDRRGHGRSSQTFWGNDMDSYADDLAAVIEALDLKDVSLVGHSTGGGEVVRYIGRHGCRQVSKAVLIGAVPPVMLKSDTNTEGLAIDVFDKLRSGLLKDHSQFIRIYLYLFMEQIDQTQMYLKDYWISFGCGVCKLASKMLTSVSRLSLKLILMRISKK